MSRVADSTIKGFLYQFNLTAVEVLDLASDEEICVEGIIEDIDVIGRDGITAIQCKYHESQEKFSLSNIYKPVLQMLKSFVIYNNPNIKFILYAFFPNEIKGEKVLLEENIKEILNTTNVDYICQYIAYIKECSDPEILQLIEKDHKSKEEKELIRKYFIENELSLKCNITDFLSTSFKLVIGESYENISNKLKSSLQNEGLNIQDIEDLFYPNTIQKIAEVSMKKEEVDRHVTKEWLIQSLRAVKTTAITRWTKELKEYNKILSARRKQLSANLNINRRKRCFLMNSSVIETFDDDIVILIADYISKYCSKVKLHVPAVFCIIGYSKEQIDNLTARIYAKGIRCETGYRGNMFFKEAFVSEPEIKQNEGWMQFLVKLCIGSEDIYRIISTNKPDDLFVISNGLPESLDLRDINVEVLEISKLEELEYLLKLKDGVEL